MDTEMVTDVVASTTLPEKSKRRYEDSYKSFKNWCLEKVVSEITEEVLMTYFLERTNNVKSPLSLWCEYSMLKTTLLVNENLDISKFLKLRTFLKKKNDGYRPKKSSVFSREEIMRFLDDAPDEIYLLMKVVAIMGIAGACRTDELLKMKLEDIEDQNNLILVKIPDTTSQRYFTLIDSQTESIHYLEILRKYINIRSRITSNNRFFMRYSCGKCVNQPVGKNIIIKVPSKIAKYLNLQNPDTYTGHSFRKTSRTLLANRSMGVFGLKRHVSWEPPLPAEEFVDDFIKNKIEVSNIKVESIDGSSSEIENEVILNLNQSLNQSGHCFDNSDPLLSPGEQSESKYIEKKQVSVDGRPIINIINCSNINLTINLSSS